MVTICVLHQICGERCRGEGPSNAGSERTEMAIEPATAAANAFPRVDRFPEHSTLHGSFVPPVSYDAISGGLVRVARTKACPPACVPRRRSCVPGPGLDCS